MDEAEKPFEKKFVQSKESQRRRQKADRDRCRELLGCESKQARFKLLRKIAYQYFLLKNACICHWCNNVVTEDTYSIEHIEPWKNSPDPKKFFFDMTNISISHVACNIAAYGRHIKGKPHVGKLKKKSNA